MVLIVGTIAGLAFFGYLIDQIGDSGPESRQKVMESDPAGLRQVEQYFQQAVAMLQAEHFEYAVQSLSEVLALQPNMPEAHANMGFALLGLGNHAAARDFFESSTDIRPSQYNAYYGLAVANEELGDLVSAVAAMQTFVHLAPQDDPYRRKAESAIWEWQYKLAKKRS